MHRNWLHFYTLTMKDQKEKSRSKSIYHCIKNNKIPRNKQSPHRSGPSSQSYGFSSSDVWMWDLNHNKGWAVKNWCFWTVVLEKILESSLDSKEIQPVNPKGNQSWIFNGRTDVEAETPILWPPDVKNWLTGKEPDAGEDWRQEEKGMTEDELAGCHYRLDRREFEWTPGIGDGQGRPDVL